MVKKSTKKFLRSPKTKVRTYEAEKLIKAIAKNTGPLVKDVDDKYYNIEQDTRSLFFKEEYKSKKQKEFGGFL